MTMDTARGRHVARSRGVRCWAVGLAIASVCACSNDTPQRAHASVASRFDVAGAQRKKNAEMVDSTQWPAYGRDYSNQRWSTLASINTKNVTQLRPVWVHHSGIPHASETNPIVIDSVMYFTTALNNVFAVDARSGKTLWHYAYPYAGHTVVDCCSTNNKGVAVYGGRVFMATIDARLVALDASNGHPIWTVQVGDNEAGYHMTGAPTVVDGLVITGVSGGEQGCRCYVDAYDAGDGHRVWRWYTVPSPAEGGWWGKWRAADDWGMSFARDLPSEHADSAKYADAWRHGGAPMWQHPAYDPETGLLFLDIGNPAPDIDASVRPGDNLYSDCIVALDMKTGKLRWYFQEISHDVWDYDATTPPVLVDVADSSGHTTKAVAEAGKDGYVYVLDRATGAPIRKSAPFVPFLNYMVRPDTAGVVVNPGPLGGSDWSPTAYSPQTGYLYVDGNYLPHKYWMQHMNLKEPAQWWGGTVEAKPSGTYGVFSAVDLKTGNVAWKDSVSKPIISGVLATAGGVVFTGSSDKQLIAYDAHSGRKLWSWKTDAAVNAPPITYEVNGKQYVAVAVTGSQTLDTPRGDELVAFALPNDSSAAGAGR
ncbi:MAG TPA: PQQ-binding-like beta-propeller repeat protein [Gemmatimonadaceae bacterium]|nr:PQQ-binding-like beta-propeller repeat protein [Gemmatimonadaceae bacterium]